MRRLGLYSALTNNPISALRDHVADQRAGSPFSLRRSARREIVRHFLARAFRSTCFRSRSRSCLMKPELEPSAYPRLRVWRPRSFFSPWSPFIRWLALGVLFVSHMLLLFPTLVANCQWWGPVMTHFETPRREVWLTIDDGPDPIHTPRMLEILRRFEPRRPSLSSANAPRNFPTMEAIRERRPRDCQSHRDPSERDVLVLCRRGASRRRSIELA